MGIRIFSPRNVPTNFKTLLKILVEMKINGIRIPNQVISPFSLLFSSAFRGIIQFNRTKDEAVSNGIQDCYNAKSEDNL